jgi:tungstate transport system substrate-binding protein
MTMERRLVTIGFAIALVSALFASGSRAAEPFIVLQSTTSTQNSGLFDHILPLFTQKTGIDVRVVAVGTGQALKNARNGDGDVVLVHARSAEDAFVAEGWGVARHDIMYNDFVVVGPVDDPAQIRDMTDATAALQKIAAASAIFLSRADDSGTHTKERALWAAAGIDVATASGTWYRETGSGMGTTLNTATGMGGYTLSDRATWISFGNKGNQTVLVEGDKRLFNPYGVILVNPARHPRVRAERGRAFINWLVGPEGQRAIAGYQIDGEQLFFPANQPPSRKPTP